MPQTGKAEQPPPSRHWIEPLAERILERKKPPFIITSGMTTSGPCHLGTLCEFLYPAVIQKFLKTKGHASEFHFIADIFDAFDSIPLLMMEFERELAPHLGKPLVAVPDPRGCCGSFGDHFLNEAKGIMEKFEIDPKIHKANELYAQGKFDAHARLFLKNYKKAKEAVSKTSMKEAPADWSPLMPVCSNCGRIATTAVTAFDETSFSYSCVRDVGYAKGCGFSGESKISEHRYKLTWRLHWPAWMDVFKTSVEGAGMDHHTRGGSWDTARAVFEEIFHKEPPITYKFGFVLFKGKKYSKSKGVGLGVCDVLSLTPPELLAYQILKHDIQENKDFDPTGNRLMQLYDDYADAGRLAQGDLARLSRAERKRAVAFSLSTEKLKWRAPFSDVLLYYQIHGDWKKVGGMVGDAGGVSYLKPFIQHWLEEGYAPEEYIFRFEPQKPPTNANAVRAFANALKEDMDALAVHNLVFEIAKQYNTQPNELFKTLYQTLLGKEKGPRFGKLVCALGAGKIKKIILDLL
ncbi:MAG: lysine--tRNA ligase [Candidatus Micrarchaeota archaeon]